MYAIMLKRTPGYPAIRNGYPTLIEETIEDLLKNYSKVSKGINSVNFPPTKEGKYQIVARLFMIGPRPVFEDLEFERRMEDLRKKGYEPVDLRELLSVLKQHKSIESLTPIHALGSGIDIMYEMLSPCVFKHYFLDSEVCLANV